MRKFGFLLFIMITILTFVSCGNGSLEETKIISPSEEKDLKPILSFGNQHNQQQGFMGWFTTDGDWIYFIDESFATEGGESEGGSIVKLSLSNSKKQEIIYKSTYLDQISVMGDWLFFTEDLEGTFYKMRKDGSDKTKIMNGVGFYVLTEKKIYYGTNEKNLPCVYATDFDGANKRKVLGRGHALIGIDCRWIYFYKEDNNDGLPEEERGPYRIKADGTKKENLPDPDLGILRPFTVENDDFFFIRYDGQRSSVVEKTVNGKEKILTSISGDLFLGSPINKENDWIYFRMGKELYKTNRNGKRGKELIYRASSPIDSIFLYNGDVLISTFSGSGVYIKQDGTAIEFGNHKE